MAKKKSSTPRAKRMTRQGRLQSFKHHLSEYTGKIVLSVAYRPMATYGVDLLTLNAVASFTELDRNVYWAWFKYL